LSCDVRVLGCVLIVCILDSVHSLLRLELSFEFFRSQDYWLLRSNAVILLSDMEATIRAFIFACRIVGFLAISSLFLHLMVYLEGINLLFGNVEIECCDGGRVWVD
jgi:hypothetical protein